MYLRLLLISAVIATVFAATSFGRAKVPSEVVVVKHAEIKMHPNPMTDHEAHQFISELTGRMLCYKSVKEYVECGTGNRFWAEVDAHLGWTVIRGSCDGKTGYAPNGWWNDRCLTHCDCSEIPPYDPYDCCGGICTESVPDLRECGDLETCILVCFFDCESFWDYVKTSCNYVF